MMPPQNYEGPTAERTGPTDRELREMYDHGYMTDAPTSGSRGGRIGLIVLGIALLAAAVYGMWWVVTGEEVVVNGATLRSMASALQS